VQVTTEAFGKDLVYIWLSRPVFLPLQLDITQRPQDAFDRLLPVHHDANVGPVRVAAPSAIDHINPVKSSYFKKMFCQVQVQQLNVCAAGAAARGQCQVPGQD
jgi:hypothetical protein